MKEVVPDVRICSRPNHLRPRILIAVCLSATDGDTASSLEEIQTGKLNLDRVTSTEKQTERVSGVL
jgi:hypothetical protein